jgi:hypothetical protein
LPTFFVVVGAPRLKAITVAAEAGAVPPVACTMIYLAVIVVPLVVPSTRTFSAFVMALADVELPVSVRSHADRGMPEATALFGGVPLGRALDAQTLP